MNSNRLIAVRVGFGGEAEKSWNLFVDEFKERDGFSRTEWFPKKLCRLRERRIPGKIVVWILICPLWLLEKNKVKINHKVFIE